MASRAFTIFATIDMILINIYIGEVTLYKNTLKSDTCYASIHQICNETGGCGVRSI